MQSHLHSRHLSRSIYRDEVAGNRRANQDEEKVEQARRQTKRKMHVLVSNRVHHVPEIKFIANLYHRCL